MAEFLLFLAPLLAGAAVLLTWRQLERGNRVSPDVKSRAPLHWRWSLHRTARLHRHLQRTVAAARACVSGSRDQLGLGDLVRDLERHACAVDDQLAVVDHLPRVNRNRLVRELRAEVHQVDALAERVIRLGRAWDGAEPSARTLAPVAERIDALEAALRDVARLDGAAPRPSVVRHRDQAFERRRRLPPVD